VRNKQDVGKRERELPGLAGLGERIYSSWPD